MFLAVKTKCLSHQTFSGAVLRVSIRGRCARLVYDETRRQDETQLYAGIALRRLGKGLRKPMAGVVWWSQVVAGIGLASV